MNAQKWDVCIFYVCTHLLVAEARRGQRADADAPVVNENFGVLVAQVARGAHVVKARDGARAVGALAQLAFGALEHPEPAQRALERLWKRYAHFGV